MTKMVKITVAALFAVGCSHFAHGAATLTISDGVDPTITIVDNGPGDFSSASGILTIQTNIGVWYLNLDTAVTKPALGSATSPVLDLFVQADSSGAGTLKVTFSDNNFGSVTAPVGANLTGFTFGIPSAPSTVSYNVYSDSGNTVGAETTLVTSFPTQSLSVNATNIAPLSLSYPSSLTQDVTVTASGATSLNVDASLQVIPEPGVVGLSGLGLTVLAFSNYFRKRK